VPRDVIAKKIRVLFSKKKKRVLSLSTDLSTESHGKLIARSWTTCSYDVKQSISQLFSANIVHIIVIWGARNSFAIYRQCSVRLYGNSEDSNNKAHESGALKMVNLVLESQNTYRMYVIKRSKVLAPF